MGWRAVSACAFAVLCSVPAALARAEPPPDNSVGGTTVPVGDLPTTGRAPTTDAPPAGGPAPSNVEPAPPAEPVKDVELAPVVHCVWIAPDMDPSTSAQEYLAGGLADDLPSVPAPTPCAADPENGVPVLVATTQPNTSIRPNGLDLPGPRRVEIWVAISHATGPASIDEVTISAHDSGGSELAVGDPEIVTAPADQSIAAAVVSGQIDSVGAESLAGMVGDGWVRLVRATLTLSYRDPCGPVAVDVAARSGELTTTATTTFEIICFHQLVTDFDHVDWRDLVPGAESVVTGDLDLATALQPTISNHGNVPMGLATTFQPLCLVSDPSTCISRFGVEVSVGDQLAARIEPTDAGTELVDPAVALCPGDLARVDFLVETPRPVHSGDYAGSVRVVGVASDGVDPDSTCDPQPTSGEPAPSGP